MKKFIGCLAAALLAITLTSCGVSSNLTRNLNLNQTNVVLQEDNFHVVKTVEAEASATYILGIGGLSREALTSNAVAELTEKAELTGSQALVNVTVKEDVQAAYIFWMKRTVRAKGVVIEFDE